MAATATATAVRPNKPLPAMRVPLLTTLALFCLTSGVAAALRPPSYNERMVAATHMVDEARARARAIAAHAAADDGTGPSDENFYSYPGSYLQGRGETNSEMNEFIRQILGVDPKELREALMQSVSSLSGKGISSSSSTEEESGQVVKETPEDYHRCLNHTAEIFVGMLEKQLWALQMVDAMGKPSPALSEGNLLWPGAYDMCFSIRANSSLPSHPRFSGKYCNAYTKIPIKNPGDIFGTAGTVALGLCIPDTCSEFDLTALLNDVLTRLGIKLQVGVQCNPRSIPLDAKAIVAIVLCSILLLLIVLGSVADVLLQFGDQWFKPAAPYISANGHTSQDEHLPLLTDSKTRTPPPAHTGPLLKLLLAFSVYTNGSKLLSTSQPKGSLTCVHGIRFLSMTWVVLGHGFLFPSGAGENTGPFLMQSINRWTFQGIANALVSVDSFFVISGLLVAYLTLKELKRRNGKLNWFMFYFHRFWRLTPAYMLVIMVYVCLSPYWGDGPMWTETAPDRDNCEDVWWTNLLYINNIVKTKDMCLGQSWYLANDMQFYCVLSPLVILPLYYFPIAGYVVAGVLVLTHCITNAALTMHNNYAPGMFAQVEGGSAASMADWGPNFYMKPYTRWGPYVIGMVAGYFLYITNCKLNIKWYVNAVLWGMATAGALAVLYGLYGASTGHPLSLSVSAFYNAMHRNVWGVCLCWVIIACVTGNGGFVNTILSWAAFVPLSRLTYCIYLLHIMIMDLYILNSRKPFYFTDINLVMFFLGILVVSYMAAAVASLAFEAPMMALEKVLLSSFRSRDEAQQQQQQQQQHHQQQNGGFHVEKE